MNWIYKQVNLWVILGGMVVAGGLVVLLVMVIWLLPASTASAPAPQTALTVIAAPSLTPTSPPAVFTPTPTPPTSVDGISIGSYVQISGTEGAGLRLRESPGTAGALRFVGMDSEVFRVKDGPKTADGFTWWLLEAPYDPSRIGWAASKYLTIINATPEPSKAAP